MVHQEKIGLAIVIALFAVLMVLIGWVFRPEPKKSHAPEDSIFIQQRMINLQKGQK